MKMALAAIAALAMLGGVSIAVAQDTTTVVHRDDAGDQSKTVIRHDNGARTVIKRHGNHVKKVHVSPNGDKTVIKKTTSPD